MKRAFLVALFGFAFAGQVFAQPVLVNSEGKLAWDAPADPDVASYQLFLSTESGVYDFENPAASVDAPATEEMIVSLSPSEGTAYYAVCRAVDAAGNQSGSSNEVSFELDNTPPGNPTEFRIVVTIVVQQ